MNSPAMIVVLTGFPLNRRMRKLRERGELMFEDEYYGKQGAPDLLDKDSPAKKDIMPGKVMPRKENMSPRDRERLQFARDRYHKIFSGLKRVINANRMRKKFIASQRKQNAWECMPPCASSASILMKSTSILTETPALRIPQRPPSSQKRQFLPLPRATIEALATKERFPAIATRIAKC